MCQAVEALHTFGMLSTHEHGALWNQVFEVAYLRSLSATEGMAWNKALLSFSELYMDPNAPDLPNWHPSAASVSNLPTPPSSRHNTPTKGAVLPVTPSTTTQNPSLSPPVQCSLPEPKRGRKPKNPGAPPKEKKLRGRPLGATDTKKRVAKGTYSGMTRREIKQIKRAEKELEAAQQ
jgi:hypothetical protein